MAVSVGIDIGKHRQHLVAMNSDRKVLAVEKVADGTGCVEFVDAVGADVVAIDSPPRWATSGSKSRECERLLHRTGIRLYWTPAVEFAEGRDGLDWMRAGMDVFDALKASGLPLATSMPLSGRQTFEVFPYSIAVVLAGHLPTPAIKHRFRRDVLEQGGFSTESLTNDDLVDAGLAAVVGLLALDGTAVPIGDPEEGTIFLPGALAASYERRGTDPVG